MEILKNLVFCFLGVFLYMSCNNANVTPTQIDNWTDRLATFNDRHYKILHTSLGCDSIPPFHPEVFHGVGVRSFDEWFYDVHCKYRTDIFEAIDIPKNSLIRELYNEGDLSITITTDNYEYLYEGVYNSAGFLLNKETRTKKETTIDKLISGIEMGVSNVPNILNCTITKIFATSYYDDTRFIVLSTQAK